MPASGGGAFQAEGPASAKALRPQCACRVPGTARKPVGLDVASQGSVEAGKVRQVAGFAESDQVRS